MDRHGIAQRIRGLIHGQYSGDLAKLALQLRVSELALRTAIDDLAPYPTLEVLAAVLQHFAVDPTWLLTGEYNSSTHSLALGSEAVTTPDAARSLLESLSRTAILPTPPSGIPLPEIEAEQ